MQIARLEAVSAAHGVVERPRNVKPGRWTSRGPRFTRLTNVRVFSSLAQVHSILIIVYRRSWSPHYVTSTFLLGFRYFQLIP